MYLSHRVLYCPSILLFIILITITHAATAQDKAAKGSSVQFRKHVISSQFVTEGVAVGDVNKDGTLDVLAGSYWFEAPTWKRHLLHADTLNPVPGYSTTFLNFCMDINNDGWVDLIRFDQPGGICVWYENPGKEQKLWRGHTLLQQAGIETPAFADVDKDGRMDLICNDAAAKQVIWLKPPVAKGDTAWQRY